MVHFFLHRAKPANLLWQSCRRYLYDYMITALEISQSKCKCEAPPSWPQNILPGKHFPCELQNTARYIALNIVYWHVCAFSPVSGFDTLRGQSFDCLPNWWGESSIQNHPIRVSHFISENTIELILQSIDRIIFYLYQMVISSISLCAIMLCLCHFDQMMTDISLLMDNLANANNGIDIRINGSQWHVHIGHSITCHCSIRVWDLRFC